MREKVFTAAVVLGSILIVSFFWIVGVPTSDDFSYEPSERGRLNHFVFYTALPQSFYDPKSPGPESIEHSAERERPRSWRIEAIEQRAAWEIKVPIDFNYSKTRYYREHRHDRSNIIANRRAKDGPSTLEVFGHVDEAGTYVYGHIGPNRLALTLTSDLGAPSLPAGDQCIAGADWMPPCRENDEVCKVFITYSGWPIYASVVRTELYRQPETVCRVVRNTLKAWTRHIDVRLSEHRAR